MPADGPRSATLIINPAARRVAKGFEASRVVSYLERRGLKVTCAEPSSAMEATRSARAAAWRGDALVFALGGDGTLRDVAEGLAGSGTALAALPGGTVNIWCREAWIPRGLRAAVDAHLEGQVVRMDLGCADKRAFLLMASLGWDAAIAHCVSPHLKRRLGDYAYIVEAFRQLPRLRTVHARWRAGLITMDRQLAMMVVSNTRLYGGRVRFTPGSTAVDGLLDVVALCPRSPLDVPRLAAKAMLRRLSKDGAVVSDRLAAMTVETPGIPYQLDGDYAGETPVTFSVDAGALAVSVPAGALPPVLRRASGAAAAPPPRSTLRPR